jgi:hypothetical protein
MSLTKKSIEHVLYDNDIDLSEGNSFFLSHIKENLFCIFTRKNSVNNFFSDTSNSSLNPFFQKVTNMLLTDELTSEGCFDSEHTIKYEYKTIKDKANTYFSSSLNFILIKYSSNKVEPISFFSYINSYIWTVCTAKKQRSNGYMSILFNHFIKLLKEGKFENEIQLYDNNLSLYLLKTNPTFEETKQFYFEKGFTLKYDYPDKIVLYLNVYI